MITRSNIPNLLRPGQYSVFEDYHIYPQWWNDVYSHHRSDKAVEYETQIQSLGLAQLKQDGAPISMGNMQQMYQSSYVMQYYGIGFQITRATIMDNLYQKEFPVATLAMRNSLETLKNINAAYLFNQAKNSAVVMADGQPLASLNHPIQGGVLANTFAGRVDLSEASVEDAITIIAGWKNLAGLPIQIMPQKVIVPSALAFTAARIFKSEYRTNTPNNDINALVHDKYMPMGYMKTQFITDPQSWGILTDEPNGFKYFLREALEIDYITDPVTQTLTNVALERYAFGNSNWRSLFWANGN